MVERGDQLDLAREQHAVAEDVARHVADADNGERSRVDVAAELAEVPLDALPGAARSDAERLVVVALRAAGRECVAEPEAVLGAIALAVSENAAVPLSAATTRYASSSSKARTPGGRTTSPPTMLSVTSSMPRISVE